MPHPENTNEITCDVTGPVVQAGHVDTVHIGTQVTNTFAGPVDARGAHFGPHYNQLAGEDVTP